MNESLMLFSDFVRHPRRVGALVPSSEFLTKEIVKRIDFQLCRNIVELGPGVGTFTKAIIKKSADDSRLFCFEVNKKFCLYLEQAIPDKRLVVINSGAEKMLSGLKQYGLKRVDCIVSGLPFKNFSVQKRKKILREIRMSLNGKGRFILFQYTNGLEKMLENYFGKVSRKFVALNIPPCFVYICEK